MSEERWDRVRKLFHDALDQPAADRAAFLKAASADAEIRAEVETLLGHTDSNLLDSPAVYGVREAMEAAINDKAARPNGDGTGSSQLLSGAKGVVIGSDDLPDKIGDGEAGTPLIVGHIIAGRFKISELIGSGGMGEVYRGFDQSWNGPSR